MKKLDARDPETASRDLVAENIERLQDLFPEAWTEGRIDFDVLKQLLGGTVDEREEKYGLNWFGKRRARQLALTPSLGTLRPCPEDSVDWDTTQNLMIEGDNLEVLKLLQKSYAGKVKLIYIDPPYNTGSDFIYPDDYRDNVANYLRLTGQSDGQKQVSSTTETAGRFHTAWLNMIYPRLKASRALLRNDGAIFISIDDAEVANLREICNELFGEENFIASFVRRRRMATGMRENPVSPDHEYILAYARNIATLKLYGTARNEADFPFRDTRSRFRSTDLTVGMTRDMRPNQFYAIRNPESGAEYWPPAARVWRFEPRTMAQHVSDDNIIWPAGNPTRTRTRPRFKTRFEDVGGEAKTNPVSTWIDTKAKSASPSDDDAQVTIGAGLNQEATKEVRDLFGEQLLEYPKPVSLLAAICGLASRGDDLVLDFFAGSGTTGHAVWSTNQSDGAKRRFILVQIPEATGRDDYPTISAITSERLRRAGKVVHAASPLLAADLGFRVFKLDSSNIRTWDPAAEDLERTLLDSVDHLKSDRTASDVLYELLLKRGVDLSAPIETRVIAKKEVHSVAAGRLLACLADKIARRDVEPLAAGIVDWHRALASNAESVCVFRDSAFEDDVAKANLAAILEQNGLSNIETL